MNIAVITLFAGMFRAVSEFGISARAIDKGALKLNFWNPRDFSEDAHRSVDDRPYGGGAGMVLSAPPLSRAIDAAKKENSGEVIYLSPQGKRLTQKILQELADTPEIILLAGRYAGIDERVVESRVAREISLGDYILAGGECAAMVLIEGIARLLPGVLGNAESAQQDSFADDLLDCPQYTRPEIFEGLEVPQILLSGDHQAIRRWRSQQSLTRTRARRPDLLSANNNT